MDKGLVNGWMDKNIWVNGKMDSEMAMVFGLQKVEFRLIQESGKMVKFLGMGSILNKTIRHIRAIFRIL